MERAESEALLNCLRDAAAIRVSAHVERGRHVIWDNTGTMHRTLRNDQSSGRLMHRAKLESAESFA